MKITSSIAEKCEAIRLAYPAAKRPPTPSIARQMILSAARYAESQGYQGDVLATMLSGAKAYAESREVSEGYCMTLRRWLNEGHWAATFEASGKASPEDLSAAMGLAQYNRKLWRSEGREVDMRTWVAMGRPE